MKRKRTLWILLVALVVGCLATEPVFPLWLACVVVLVALGLAGAERLV